ncbi:zinc finger HIT domain-containing protein 3-like [Mizuhopecten yessoensis]|uniref:Zinc finger HIT domain-containing protein 3 n=1 Tax=Mizuhopecten yessoensis TaxID=6573 RepID=A0A210PUT5_MIZYE|nr:zinc finger HIT domain-containing protein 3-like [Mizuhopecten yessoensis]OWF40253.1 Zinc finger HIT domain-containing protein 3 [Mizuhopecten yessoensis]
MTWIQCQVCEEETSKYKCPKCALQYCSVGCYKNHKETNCVSLQETKKPECSSTVTTEGSQSYDKEMDILFKPEDDEEATEDTLSVHQLQQLGKCPDLHKLLENPHLRDMMTGLTKADNPRTAMDKAMQEPIFTEFVDQCLNIVEDKDCEDSLPWS